jgi:hypothetical protein
MLRTPRFRCGWVPYSPDDAMSRGLNLYLSSARKRDCAIGMFVRRELQSEPAPTTPKRIFLELIGAGRPTSQAPETTIPAPDTASQSLRLETFSSP